MDFMSVGSTLASFTSAIPTQVRTKLVLRDGLFSETYGEERTPQYVLPDPSNMVVFLLRQLPLLNNTILATKLTTGTGYDKSGLASSFRRRWMSISRRRRLQYLLCSRASADLSPLLRCKGNLGSLAM